MLPQPEPLWCNFCTPPSPYTQAKFWVSSFSHFGDTKGVQKFNARPHDQAPNPLWPTFALFLLWPPSRYTLTRFQDSKLWPFLRHVVGPQLAKFSPTSPAPSVGGIRTLSNTMSRGPPAVFTLNSILMCKAIFAQWSRVEPRDRQTERQSEGQTAITGNYSLHITHSMRPTNNGKDVKHFTY